MAAKKDASLTIKVSEFELAMIKEAASDLEMDVSELVRACIGLALPILEKVPFTQRLRLDDNLTFSKKR